MHVGTGLLTRALAKTSRSLPVPFPDHSIQWYVTVRRCSFRFLQNGEPAANAHTVAGQWRLFTAFPYIPRVFAMVGASRFPLALICCSRVYTVPRSHSGALFRHPASCSAIDLLNGFVTSPVCSVVTVSISASPHSSSATGLCNLP